MEHSTGLVAGSHNRNQLVVIRKDQNAVSNLRSMPFCTTRHYQEAVPQFHSDD